jgi:glycerophosphoryl diester phosphodiesterase
MRLALPIVACLVASPAFGFDVQGHRGARGLAPENTLPAFAKALSIGVDTLELDVGLTSDFTVAIAHDRTLNPDIARGPDGAYVAPGIAIRSLSLDRLKQYDVGVLRPGSNYAKQFPEQAAVPGTRIPTLAELTELVERSGNRTVRFNIETKLSPLAPEETIAPDRFAAILVETLRNIGIASRTTIQSFDWRTLKAVQRIAPEIPTVCLTIERGGGDNVQRGRPGPSPWTAGLDIDEFGSVPRLVKAASCKVWSPFHGDVTPAALAEAKSLGLSTVVWTVNDPADMTRLIEAGVDGIISDYPDRLRAVMSAKGMKLPAPTPVSAPSN